MNDKGIMFNQTWLYQGGNWYAFKSSGAMIANDWLYDRQVVIIYQLQAL